MKMERNFDGFLFVFELVLKKGNKCDVSFIRCPVHSPIPVIGTFRDEKFDKVKVASIRCPVHSLIPVIGTFRDEKFDKVKVTSSR